MTYFIPRDPEGVTHLKALCDGKIDSRVECFLCHLYEGRTSRTVKKSAPIGLYNDTHFRQAEHNIPFGMKRIFSLTSGEKVKLIVFSDYSCLLGFVTDKPGDIYFDQSLAILPVALHYPFDTNQPHDIIAPAIANDLEKWRDYMSTIPKLCQSVDIADPPKGLALPWARHDARAVGYKKRRNLTEDLAQILAKAGRAFQAQHDPKFAGGLTHRAFLLMSRIPSRSGALSDVALKIQLADEDRGRLEAAHQKLESEIISVLRDPELDIPVDSLVNLAPTQHRQESNPALSPAILADTSALRAELTAHERISAIAEWDNLVGQASERARART